jgi:hypothetical protein
MQPEAFTGATTGLLTLQNYELSKPAAMLKYHPQALLQQQKMGNMRTKSQNPSENSSVRLLGATLAPEPAGIM